MELTATATATMIKGSPQKINLVAKAIRGLPVDQALARLSFMNRRAAKDAYKVVASAVANAENNHDLDIDRLVVSEAYVGKTLIMRRFRPRARGRVGRIQKPYSRLTVVVKEQEDN